MVKKISETRGVWNFNFSEAGLTSTNEINQIGEECKLFHTPTIVFAQNEFSASHSALGFSLTFNAVEALRYVNYQFREGQMTKGPADQNPGAICYIPEKLFVKHAEKWKTIELPKDVEMTKIEEISDSFFVTPFRGRVKGDIRVKKVQESVIPLHKLGPQHHIELYQQGSFYEDELDDNGLIQYEYKFRLMQNSWFALVRCYARIDNVVVLVLDTRIYWEEGCNRIARQFMVKRITWDKLKEVEAGLPNGWVMNPNQSHFIYPHMTELLVDNEYVQFGPQQ